MKAAQKPGRFTNHDRVWAKHQTVSDFEHLVAARLLRSQRNQTVRPVDKTEVAVRDLADYDTALGLTDGVA
jgi:hypothetical protein